MLLTLKCYYTTRQKFFCSVILCLAIRFVTILLKARHEELIVWRIDEFSLLLQAIYEHSPLTYSEFSLYLFGTIEYISDQVIYFPLPLPIFFCHI